MMNEKERESQIASARAKKIQEEKVEIWSDSAHESNAHST